MSCSGYSVTPSYPWLPLSSCVSHGRSVWYDSHPHCLSATFQAAALCLRYPPCPPWCPFHPFHCPPFLPFVHLIVVMFTMPYLSWCCICTPMPPFLVNNAGMSLLPVKEWGECNAGYCWCQGFFLTAHIIKQYWDFYMYIPIIPLLNRISFLLIVTVIVPSPSTYNLYPTYRELLLYILGEMYKKKPSVMEGTVPVSLSVYAYFIPYDYFLK